MCDYHWSSLSFAETTFQYLKESRAQKNDTEYNAKPTSKNRKRKEKLVLFFFSGLHTLLNTGKTVHH